MKKKYSKTQLISELLRFREIHGRFPLHAELTAQSGYPSGSTYNSRFGSFNTALEQARRRM